MVLKRYFSCYSVIALLLNYSIYSCNFSVLCVYSPEKETEIRTETLLNSTYDAISRPSEVTTVAVGVNILSIDELVSHIMATIL